MAEQKFLGQEGTDVLVEKIKELGFSGLTIRPNFYPVATGSYLGWKNNAIHICSLYHAGAGNLAIADSAEQEPIYKAIVYCAEDYSTYVLSTIYCRAGGWNAAYDLLSLNTTWEKCQAANKTVGQIGNRYSTSAAASIEEITAQEVTDKFNS